MTTTVTFEVIGSSTTLRSILWRTPDGDTTDPVSSGTLPWSKTVEITAVEGVLFVNAPAYAAGVSDPNGSLSCRVTVDGLVVEQDGPSSTGPRCWTTVQRALKAKAEQH
ncbi:hypothetical protein Asp14428_36590 [Actinoplanes sp. NBRC 14428]|nr:hypothetical protein Asp14428_36590 [Actinoplanes sp. NBRC 14428]